MSSLSWLERLSNFGCESVSKFNTYKTNNIKHKKVAEVEV